MHSYTFNSKTLHGFRAPARTLALAALLFFALRSVFWLFPDAFVAYPETMPEFQFYISDQQCAVQKPEPQIVLQGTSRLMGLPFIPIGQQYWHTKDKILNLSVAANTFWQLAAVLRRHPHLLDQTELQIIDVVPNQLRATERFPETHPLLLREGTLKEKLMIRNPFQRAQAMLDYVIPFWSQRHSAQNWYRAVTEHPRTSEQRLAVLNRNGFASLADVRAMQRSLAGYANDANLARNLVAQGMHSGSFSRIQAAALAELAAYGTKNRAVLFIRPPYRADFRAIRDQNPEMLEGERRLHDLLNAIKKPAVVVQWYENPEELNLVDADYTGDGVHLSDTGLQKMERHLARTYREIWGLK